MEQEKTIYYHVGLEKTGSTFLQNNVFPYFKGVTYLPKKNYEHFLNHSPDYPAGNYLVTHELNVNWITDEYLRKIDERYANDWEKRVSYTQKRREIEV